MRWLTWIVSAYLSKNGNWLTGRTAAANPSSVPAPVYVVSASISIRRSDLESDTHAKKKVTDRIIMAAVAMDARPFHQSRDGSIVNLDHTPAWKVGLYALFVTVLSA